MTKKNHLTKAQEARGGRHANKVLNGERDRKGPALSESFTGGKHHTGRGESAKAHEAAGGRKANRTLAAERRADKKA